MKENWIKIENSLPQDGQKVFALVKSQKGCMYTMRHDGYFRDTIYSCRFNVKDFIIESHGPCIPATHWMPQFELPE